MTSPNLSQFPSSSGVETAPRFVLTPAKGAGLSTPAPISPRGQSSWEAEPRKPRALWLRACQIPASLREYRCRQSQAGGHRGIGGLGGPEQRASTVCCRLLFPYLKNGNGSKTTAYHNCGGPWEPCTQTEVRLEMQRILSASTVRRECTGGREWPLNRPLGAGPPEPLHL